MRKAKTCAAFLIIAILAAALTACRTTGVRSKVGVIISSDGGISVGGGVESGGVGVGVIIK